MTLSSVTLNYKTRLSTRTVCKHCEIYDNKPDQKHFCCFDPNLKKWVDICLNCEMVDLADKQETV